MRKSFWKSRFVKLLTECAQNDLVARCLFLTQMLYDQIVLFSNLNVGQLTEGQYLP